jgi:hypothetical protein
MRKGQDEPAGAIPAMDMPCTDALAALRTGIRAVHASMVRDSGSVISMANACWQSMQV